MEIEELNLESQKNQSRLEQQSDLAINRAALETEKQGIFCLKITEHLNRVKELKDYLKTQDDDLNDAKRFLFKSDQDLENELQALIQQQRQQEINQDLSLKRSKKRHCAHIAIMQSRAALMIEEIGEQARALAYIKLGENSKTEDAVNRKLKQRISFIKTYEKNLKLEVEELECGYRKVLTRSISQLVLDIEFSNSKG